MRSMVFLRTARVVALVIATTFSWSVWTACAEAAFSTPKAPMACCKDGELTCAPHGSASDCCKTDAARPRDAVASAKIAPVHSLSAVLVTWAALPDAADLQSLQIRILTPASPPGIAPGPPPYIAFSSLLI